MRLEGEKNPSQSGTSRILPSDKAMPSSMGQAWSCSITLSHVTAMVFASSFEPLVDIIAPQVHGPQ